MHRVGVEMNVLPEAAVCWTLCHFPSPNQGCLSSPDSLNPELRLLGLKVKVHL